MVGYGNIDIVLYIPTRPSCVRVGRRSRVYFMAWSYTDGTNWGEGVNWVGQGGIVGEDDYQGRKDFMERKDYLEGKDHTERLVGKTIQPIYYYVK